MSYGQLYVYCQTLPTPIRTNAVRDKVLELVPDSSVRFFVDHELDQSKVRGYFVKANNPDHPFAKQAQGASVIAYCKQLNDCWRRFVTFKELMHLFDNQIGSVSSSGEFETLLNEFMVETNSPSPGVASERNCLWMAIGIFCPEVKRVEFARQRELGQINDADIAQQLKMPAQYVPLLFIPSYKRFIDICMKLS